MSTRTPWKVPVRELTRTYLAAEAPSSVTALRPHGPKLKPGTLRLQEQELLVVAARERQDPGSKRRRRLP